VPCHLWSISIFKVCCIVCPQALIDVKRHQVQRYHKTTDTLEQSEIELDPFVVFRKALENGMPRMHLKKVIRAGSVLQVSCIDIHVLICSSYQLTMIQYLLSKGLLIS